VYWRLSDAPLKGVLTNLRDGEAVAVRRYLENNTYYCRFQLLQYFDPELARSLPPHDRLLCCDVCATMMSVLLLSPVN